MERQLHESAHEHDGTPVRELLRSGIVTVPATASVREAAALLRQAGVGALAVLDGDEVAGILSERDIVGSLAAGDDPDQRRVDEVMSREPRYLTLTDTVTAAAEIMLAVGCRHLPVIDDGVPVGMISLRDVTRALAG